MNVSNVSSTQATAAYSATTAAKTKVAETETQKNNDVAAVYTPSAQGSATAKTYTQNTDLVNQLKLDAETRTNNLQDLVSKLMSQQATAYGNATNIWSFLREGNFTVDAETKAQAQADIAEDGYWGVNQTSDRIVSFATALTGGDPDKLDSMIEAFKKGYAQAEKTWGGKLPEISQKTYDAVLEKFEKLREENAAATGAIE